MTSPRCGPWELGAVAIKAAVERAGVPGDAVDEALIRQLPDGRPGPGPGAPGRAPTPDLPDIGGRRHARSKMCGSGMRARTPWSSVGPAVLLDLARIQQLGDIGMIEAGQDLSFRPQAHAEIGVDGRAVDDFDCYLCRVLTVGAFSEINGAGSAMAEDFSEPVVANDSFEESLTAIACREFERSTQGMRQR